MITVRTTTDSKTYNSKEVLMIMNIEKLSTISDFLNQIGNVNRYSLLDRLESDCKYFLGFGNKCERQLWAKDVKYQIKYMKILWLMFPINDKPKWTSMEEILGLEKMMA